MRARSALLVLGIALVAVNLRPAVAAVGTVLPEIRDDLRLTGVETAVLTTLPVLCFGLLATVAPRLARRFGIERVIMGVLVLLGVAQAVRVLDGPVPLFLGTVCVGAGIAVANVLLPPLVKRDFPTRTGLMMGIYTMALSGSAAFGSGLTVPLSELHGLGWRWALGLWALLAVLAAAVWAPQVRARTAPSAPPTGPSLLRDVVAWQVTVFFGLQALTFYALLAWLPTIYRDEGYSPSAAGFLLSVSGLVQIPVALVLPGILTKARNQVPHVTVATVSFASGLAGVLFAPTAAPYLWMVLLGVGSGAAFAIALTLFVVRTRKPADTARLSAMAQSIGYVITAFGPLLTGVVYDATGSWTVPLVLLLILTIPMLWSGVLSSRNSFLAEHAEPSVSGA